jgi:hypothetical protein
MKNKYTISISFSTDKELTDDEISMLNLQVAAQVEEPVNEEGEEVEYTTQISTLEIERKSK